MKKKLLLSILLLAVCLGFAPFAHAQEEDPYLSLMLRACACGDIEAGRAAEKCRTAEPKISFDELYLLARVIYSEAGSDKLPSELRFLIGEVVMNRVASCEFPNSIEEVIYEKGQYAEVNSREFQWYTYPGEECSSIALALLMGERHMPASVVFQANFKQGGGVYAEYATPYGMCYLCYSENTELYENIGID